MRAVVLEAPHRASVQEIPDPTWQPHEVIVRVERCGLCGTDQHLYDGDYALTSYFEDAITLLQSGAVRVERLVSHRLPLSGYEEGLLAARAGEGSMKVQLAP